MKRNRKVLLLPLSPQNRNRPTFAPPPIFPTSSPFASLSPLCTCHQAHLGFLRTARKGGTEEGRAATCDVRGGRAVGRWLRCCPLSPPPSSELLSLASFVKHRQGNSLEEPPPPHQLRLCRGRPSPVWGWVGGREGREEGGNSHCLAAVGASSSSSSGGGGGGGGGRRTR